MLTTNADVCGTQNIIVIKIGGSVLVDQESYRSAATFLVRRLHRCSTERLVVVVSAQNGVTDELAALARSVTSSPNPRTLDLLWSTGELRSVALLALHLEQLGVAAVGLNVHETGLSLRAFGQGDAGVEAFCCELRKAFDDHCIVVVPGFFATLSSGTLVSLGRGGSDLSAVLLASEFDAGRCELVKDVPGYFTEDPNVNPDAEYLSWISYDTAIGMAERGCELVQRVALDAARERGLQLVVRTLDDAIPGTVVSAHTNHEGA